MKAVIYARYSSDNQREESIEGQIRDCRAYAEYNGIDIVGEYIDRAFSAKTDDRPDFQRMVSDSSKKLFDVVLVWKLDRFARNRYDSAFYRYTLRKNGVKLISVKENISDGPEGIILESMIEGYEHSNGHNKNQIWIETVYIRCKSKAEFAQNEFRLFIIFAKFFLYER